MKLWDIFSADALGRAMAEGLVVRRVNPLDPHLELYTYTDKAMYTPGAWDNPAVRHCRGLIVDVRDDTVVARPWAKFFNYGQKEAATIGLDEPVTVMDKLDGSLGIGYLDPATGRPRIATRGSFASDQAWHATEWLWENRGLLGNQPAFRTWTPLFEVIYPENRIVCDYGDRDELVMLGAVSIEHGVAATAREAAAFFEWKGSVAEEFYAGTLADALRLAPRPGAEGIVVLADRHNQSLVKIKQEDYVHLHRIVTGLNERAVWERMMAGDFEHHILDGLPDELHGWVKRTYRGLRDKQHSLIFAACEVHNDIMGKCGSVDVSRKEYAALANQHPDLRPYLFMLLDGKDIGQAALKSLRPEGESARPNYRKEAA